MDTFKHLDKIYLIFTLLLTQSCNRPRRLYLKNKSDNAVMLRLDTAFAAEKGSIQARFKDSLDGKQIMPGNMIINFGAGKWKESDEKNLKVVLQHIAVIKTGTNKSFQFPKNMDIGHGILISELIVNIDEP